MILQFVKQERSTRFNANLSCVNCQRTNGDRVKSVSRFDDLLHSVCDLRQEKGFGTNCGLAPGNDGG